MVVVISGADKGSTGRVLRILPAAGKVIVEGVNTVKRHIKGTPEQPGQIVTKEAPIHVSNVALWNAEQKRPMRASWRILEDGQKVRVDRKTGELIDNP